MRLPRLRKMIAATAAVAILSGCGVTTAATSSNSTSTNSNVSTISTNVTTVSEALSTNLEVTSGDVSTTDSNTVDVTLSGSKATSNSDAVTNSDGTVTISEAGTYRLSGNLDGQLVINSTGSGAVRLILDGVKITSQSSAAINVVDAESLVVILADESTNTLTDAATYEDTSTDAPTGALYSTADLTIGGTGSLQVVGNSNNGIVGKDGLTIVGGNISVTAVDDGIIGKDYLAITSGEITVDAVDDGLKSDNTTDTGAGFVLLEGGSVRVSSQDDAIKGVQVLVSGGTLNVTGSQEAMEASVIIIDGGALELHSADDGINATSSADDSSETQPGMGAGEMQADNSLRLVINGGTLKIWSSGDGIDSNGTATITGGDVTVYGPTSDGNGALDVNGTFTITGGTLKATGSAGMLIAPSTDSTQGWLALALPSTAPADSEVEISDSSGNQVASFTVAKEFAAVVYSSSQLETGETYTVTVNGESIDVASGVAPSSGRGPR